MKIGIITFHAASNHGAALQAYALQTHLRKAGHDTFFINYLFNVQARSGFRRWIGRTPPATASKINSQLRFRPFSNFQARFLIVGQTEYSDHIQLQNNPPAADVYICGSDQIWNPEFISQEKDERAFWLDFGDSQTRRIAYAASFGVNELKGAVQFRYKDYAKRFHAIGVREEDAVELVRKQLGRPDAVWVPDPTILLSQIEYNEVINKEKQQQPYLFSYILGQDNKILSQQIIDVVTGKMKIKCYIAYRRSLISNLIHNGYIGPSEWLSILCRSRLVVTNSFHATIFSLLYHKTFIVLLRRDQCAGMNSRIFSVLGKVGLQHRAIREFSQATIDKLMRDDVNWEYVDEKLREFREIGIQFLQKALS